MTSSYQQLALPFPYQPTLTAAEFLAAASNEVALTWLERTPEWPDGRLLLWGEPGCGKTHMLHLWAERASASLWVGAALRPEVPPPTAPLAIDAADTADERALLHWLNAAREAGNPVLLAGRTPPARWQIGLPDLASRLRAVTTVAIAPPEDTLLRGLLTRLLADRQLAVPAALQDWLLLRLPRTAAACREAAARLADDGGPIDRQLVARVLDDLLRQDAGTCSS